MQKYQLSGHHSFENTLKELSPSAWKFFGTILKIMMLHCSMYGAVQKHFAESLLFAPCAIHRCPEVVHLQSSICICVALSGSQASEIVHFAEELSPRAFATETVCKRRVRCFSADEMDRTEQSYAEKRRKFSTKITSSAEQSAIYNAKFFCQYWMV